MYKVIPVVNLAYKMVFMVPQWEFVVVFNPCISIFSTALMTLDFGGGTGTLDGSETCSGGESYTDGLHRYLGIFFKMQAMLDMLKTGQSCYKKIYNIFMHYDSKSNGSWVISTKIVSENKYDMCWVGRLVVNRV